MGGVWSQGERLLYLRIFYYNISQLQRFLNKAHYQVEDVTTLGEYYIGVQ